jgi:HlyD family secretion protein
MRRFRWILLALLVVGLFGTVMALRRNARQAVDVLTERVVRQGVFRSSVTASGEIIAARYADIGSSVMGRIVDLRVAEGDRVRRGQVLAVIDPVQARATATAAEAQVSALTADAAAAEQQVRTAEAERAAAEARLLEAEQQLTRQKALFGEGLAPRSDFDQAQAARDAARAQAASAAASVDRAQQARRAATGRTAQARAQAAGSRDILGKTEIAAPMDGVVSRLQVREGEMVVIGIQNQPGTTLMTVSDLAAIDAEVKVAEADVLRLSVGLPAQVVLDALPGRRFSGKVVEIGASALPVTGAAAAREFKVVVRLDTPDAALRPGLTCDAEILTAERTNVTTVPLQAVVLRAGPGGSAATSGATPAPGPWQGGAGTGAASPDQTGVFAVEGDVVKFQPVTTGIIGGLSIEVAGVPEGTTIVTGPYQALRDLQDGTRVKTRR